MSPEYDSVLAGPHKGDVQVCPLLLPPTTSHVPVHVLTQARTASDAHLLRYAPLSPGVMRLDVQTACTCTHGCFHGAVPPQEHRPLNTHADCTTLQTLGSHLLSVTARFASSPPAPFFAFLGSWLHAPHLLTTSLPCWWPTQLPRVLWATCWSRPVAVSLIRLLY